MNITHTEASDPLRKAEYPPLTDLADALYWNANGNPLPLTQYYDKISAVKLKYPKIAGE